MAADTFNSFVYDTPDKTTKQSSDEKTGIALGIFFDGTCNNKFNVATKTSKDEDAKEAAEDYKSNDSYGNDPTNVERMWNYYIEGDPQYKIYIEGAGTSSSQDDSGTINYGSDDTLDGTGLGHFENGIRGKVRKACEKAAGKAANKKETLSFITFDVFGFSRGAAAARNFVHEVTQAKGIRTLNELKYVDSQLYVDSQTKDNKDVPKYGFLGYFLQENGFKIDKINSLLIQIRFVGIYDTVSSYSLFPIDFSNDAAELNLNTVNYWAKKLVHLTAADEHRKNFALTHIYASDESQPGKRIEISVPGVHSDIGGSYVNKADEIIQVRDYDGFSNNIKVKLENEKQQLVKQGWYKEKELKINKWNELIGTRYKLSNKYSFIPLHFMYQFASEFKSGLFISKLLTDYMIAQPYNPKMAEPMANYIRARFEANWMSYWEEQDNHIDLFNPGNKSTSTYSAFSSEPDPLATRRSELLAEIEVNLNLNGLAGVCPNESTVLCYAKHVLANYAFKNGPSMIYMSAQDIIDSCWGSDFIKPKKLSDFSARAIREKLPALTEELIKQNYLRILRNKLLHWSARYGGTGRPNAPAKNRQRANY